jgi:hypothetical protein
MPARLRLAALLAVSLAAPLPAADPPPPVEKLVEQLGHPSFPVRERASKALRERGPGVLPALRKALESKDEEVRKRVETLIPPLEIEEALLPKRVTVKATDGTLTSILGDIEKQTKMKVTANGPAAKATIDATDAPFWDVLDRLGKATGRGPAMQGYPLSLHLAPNPRRSPFVNVRGPFRLEMTWAHEDRDVDLTEARPGEGPTRTHGLTLAVSVLAEPRLTLLKVRPAKVEEAVDDQGQSLIEPDGKGAYGPQRQNRGAFRGEHLHSADIRLRRAAGSKVARVVRGTIPVHAILIRKPVIVTSKVMESTGTAFKAGNDSLSITRVNNQGGSIDVEVLVPRQDDGNRHNEWYDRFHLEDEAGNRFQMNGRGSSYNGREYRINMYFAPPFNKKNVGPPAKLIFEEWVVHDHAIPFEFRDVPLP